MLGWIARFLNDKLNKVYSLKNNEELSDFQVAVLNKYIPAVFYTIPLRALLLLLLLLLQLHHYEVAPIDDS